jgi:hypothetical protein
MTTPFDNRPGKGPDTYGKGLGTPGLIARIVAPGHALDSTEYRDADELLRVIERVYRLRCDWRASKTAPAPIIDASGTVIGHAHYIGTF